MSKVTITAVLLATLLLATAPVAAEDRIFLKNGSVLTGTILKETESEIIIQIPDLGKIFVSRNQIERVEGAAPPPDTPDTPVVPTPTDPVDPPTHAPLDVKFKDLSSGETVLVLMKEKDGGTCRHSGQRFVARVEVVGKKRVKLLINPDAGALGFMWIRREEVSRVIRLDGNPDRRLILIEGMEVGSWMKGVLADGKAFSGKLAGLNGEASLSIAAVEEGEVKIRNVPLLDIREAESLTRTRLLSLKLRTVQIGEPVRMEIDGRKDPLEGRWAGEDPDFYLLDVHQGPELEPSREKIFRYMPITAFETLPESLRPALQGSKEGDHLTVTTVSLRDGALRRRYVTGKILQATTKSLALATPEGREDFAVEDLRDALRPPLEDVPGLLARLPESGSDSVLHVLPGMTREKATELLGEAHPGIDVVFTEGKVTKVYCAPPLEGPVFGLDLGTDLRRAMQRTDLVFDTRIEPVEGPEPRVCTLLSHTVTGMVVRLFVNQSDRILAIEISAR